MPKKVLILLAQGFEEVEAVTVIDYLRRAEIEVYVAGVTEPFDCVAGSHNIGIRSDGSLDQALSMEFDMIVLPGGMPGTEHLLASTKVEEILAKHKRTYLAAICAAPRVLAKYGYLKDKRAVCCPGCEEELMRGGALITDALVEEHQNIITSKGPSTAVHFALTLIEKLEGRAKTLEIKKQILL